MFPVSFSAIHQLYFFIDYLEMTLGTALIEFYIEQFLRIFESNILQHVTANCIIDVFSMRYYCDVIIIHLSDTCIMSKMYCLN